MLGSSLFSIEDMEQFYQLIGYSVSGFGEMSGFREETVTKADELAEGMRKTPPQPVRHWCMIRCPCCNVENWVDGDEYKGMVCSLSAIGVQNQPVFQVPSTAQNLRSCADSQNRSSDDHEVV
jgi:hypothetical protein